MAESVLRRFGGSAALALAALLLLGATLHYAQRWLAEREQAFARARSDLATAADQYRSASDDRAVYRQYATRFRAMRARGWIGPERRLTWIEALQAINTGLELPVLRYEIGRRAPVKGARAPDTLRVYRTPMVLTMVALHEYDVLRLLRRLAEQGDGLMAVSQCELRRNDPIRFDPDARNVEADCALDWYTLEMDATDAE